MLGARRCSNKSSSKTVFNHNDNNDNNTKQSIMACSLGCCGGFCLFVSVICAIMQFVFYALLSNDSERIDIGESPHDREQYKNTPLITAIVYCV